MAQFRSVEKVAFVDGMPDVRKKIYLPTT